MKAHLKPIPAPHADIHWQAGTTPYNELCEHHKILLPVLVSALTTHPMEPSPQAEQTVFKREDRANFRVGNRQTESSKSFAGQRTIGGISLKPQTKGKTGKMPVSFLDPHQARVGSSGKYFRHTVHLE